MINSNNSMQDFNGVKQKSSQSLNTIIFIF